MTSRSFDFWAGVARYVVAGAALLCVLFVFGAMAGDAGGIDLSVPWLAQ